MLNPSSKIAFLILFFLLTGSITGFAQVQIRIVAGQINIGNTMKPDERKYTGYWDSLEVKLKVNPNDTTSLFLKALLLEQFNNQLAKPSPDDKAAFQNLINAKNLVKQLFDLKMQDFRLKVLRAQIYKDLTYRFSGDESWKFPISVIDKRKNWFYEYKNLANKYYGELENLDSKNSYEYQTLKVNSNYAIK